MKLTRRSNNSRAAFAFCVCLSLNISFCTLGCSPASAFPFFHRKHDGEQTQKSESSPLQNERTLIQPDSAPAMTAPRMGAPKFLPAAPAFRPYNPTSVTLPAVPPAEKTPLPAAPDLPDGSSIQPDLPGQPKAHHPPAVLERPPIPPPPAVQAPLMVSSGEATPALAWRAVAYKLWLTPQSSPSKRTKAQSAFTAAAGATMKALMKALEEAGWRTQQFNAIAGHLLAARPDAETSKTQLIFAAHAGEGGGTVVRAAVDPDSKNFDKSQIESIFSRAQDIVSRNELL